MQELADSVLQPAWGEPPWVARPQAFVGSDEALRRAQHEDAQPVRKARSHSLPKLLEAVALVLFKSCHSAVAGAPAVGSTDDHYLRHLTGKARHQSRPYGRRATTDARR